MNSPRYEYDWLKYFPFSHDDDRMSFLYSDFQGDKIQNSSHWNSKLSQWKQFLITLCKDAKIYSVTYSQLKSVRWKGKTALGLPTIVSELVSNGDLLPLSALYQRYTQTWMSWGFSTVMGAPFRWAFRSIAGGDGQPNDNERFVVVEAFEENTLQLRRILEQQISACKTSVVIPYEAILLDLSAEEKDLCLASLQASKYLSIVTSPDGKRIVKFVRNPGWTAPKLTQAEVAECRLLNAKELVSSQLDAFMTRLSKAKETLSSARKDRHIALTALRRVKLLEKNVSLKEGTLDNVELLLDQLNDASTQRQVLDALFRGGEMIRLNNIETRKQLDQTLDAVHEAVDVTAEFNDTFNDLNSTLNSLGGVDLDDVELERELEALCASDDIQPSNSVIQPDIPESVLPDTLINRPPNKPRDNLRKATTPTKVPAFAM